MRLCYYTTLTTTFVVTLITALVAAASLEITQAENFTFIAAQLALLIGVSAIVDDTTPDNLEE